MSSCGSEPKAKTQTELFPFRGQNASRFVFRGQRTQNPKHQSRTCMIQYLTTSSYSEEPSVQRCRTVGGRCTSSIWRTTLSASHSPNPAETVERTNVRQSNLCLLVETEGESIKPALLLAFLPSSYHQSALRRHQTYEGDERVRLQASLTMQEHKHNYYS